MSKTKKVIYWIATVWLALGMASSGIVQLLQLEEENEFILRLGYPSYFLLLLGGWKILGVIVVLAPGLALLKEWAYAGFFFVASGAIFSHIAADTANEMFPATLLLVLTVVSWYLRPESRRLVPLRA